MNRNRQEKGITLIALVITIIVLLILAGVAIATLTGNSSIIENSNKAAQAYNETASEDDALLGKLENKLKEYTGTNNGPKQEITAEKIANDTSYIGKYVNYEVPTGGDPDVKWNTNSSWLNWQYGLNTSDDLYVISGNARKADGMWIASPGSFSHQYLRVVTFNRRS